MKGLKSIKSYLKLICMIFIFATIILLLQIDSNAVEISNINVELTTNRPAKPLEIGEKFDISIKASSVEEINTIVGYLQFDKKILKVAKNEQDDYCVQSNNDWISIAYHEENGEFGVFRYGLEKIDNLVVATITFEVIGEETNTEIKYCEAYACKGAYIFNAEKDASIIIGNRSATQCIITYNVNGGIENSMSPTQTFNKGEESTITAQKPRKEGHRFVGWSLSAESEEVKYRPGDTFTSDEDMTLYAVWAEASNMQVNLLTNAKEVKAGDTIIIGISVDVNEVNLTEFLCNLEYDENIFEEITEADIIGINKWEDPLFDDTIKQILVKKSDETTKSGTICLIKMNAKSGIEIGKTTIAIRGIEGKNNDEYYVADDCEVIFNAEELDPDSPDPDDPDPDDPDPDDPDPDNPDPDNPDPDSDLFLESDIYTIGETHEYIAGDEYMLEISEKTTLADLLSNCYTNGVMSVYGLNGRSLAFTDYVGTGMTMKVKKGEKEIEITLIVKQDLDGDGMVTVADLSEIVAHLNGSTNLTKMQIMAGDIDNDKDIKVVDLSSIIEKLS